MRHAKWTLALAALLLGAIASEAALAHGKRGRLSIGLHFGAPLYWHSWHGWPSYHYYPGPVYYPAPIAVPSSPPVYVERQDAPAAAEPESFWYYCAATRGYYPYVKECAAGWQKVPPAPQ
jgi:hypothetical protein